MDSQHTPTVMERAFHCQRLFDRGKAEPHGLPGKATRQVHFLIQELSEQIHVLGFCLLGIAAKDGITLENISSYEECGTSGTG
jgi:hypothetical protein